MTRAVIKIRGTRFVLIPENELTAIEEAALPPMPHTPPAEGGTCEAFSFIRASIARDIIKERWALGLTQAQLAKLAGVRHSTLARLESGEHEPSIRVIDRVDAALKRVQAQKEAPRSGKSAAVGSRRCVIKVRRRGGAKAE
jgi:DNA-binding XRE family transcriptional regulator